MWEKEPACAAMPELFESERIADHRQAKTYCERCPIISWCRSQLDVALSDFHWKMGPRGTWAGHYVSKQGIDVFPRMQKAVVAQCGTPSGYKRHLRAKEETCDDCRRAVNEYRASRSS